MKDNSLSHDDETGRSYSAWDYVTLRDPAGHTCPALRRNAFVVSLKALTNGIAFRSENLRWFSSNQIYCTHGNSFCLGKLSVCCTKSTLSLSPVLSTTRPLVLTPTSQPAFSKAFCSSVFRKPMTFCTRQTYSKFLDNVQDSE